MKNLNYLFLSISVLIFFLTGCNKDTSLTIKEIKLSETEITLVKGSSCQINATVEPTTITDAIITWHSSDESVAMVSNSGKIAALEKGTCTITATCDKAIASCTVTVTGKKAESLKLNKDEIVLKKGEEEVLTAEILPLDAEDKTVTWESSDSNIATVNQNGTVSAIAPGNSIIVAKIGDVSDTCMVTVNGIAVENITLDTNSISLNIGGTYELSATIIPSNADYGTIEWSSSDENIATVSADGLVSAINKGNATITAKAGNAIAECSVMVIGSANIGDYYYSDGTYSSELISGKDVIGIVFWTGDPTQYDMALKREHPECTNGLVVALDYKTDVWQKSMSSVSNWISENCEDYTSIEASTSGNPDDNLEKISGYNNTKAIELFNENNSYYSVKAVEQIIAYRDEVIAPQNSSDWYLPSIKELSLLCSGECEGSIADIEAGQTSIKDLINSKVAEIDGASKLFNIFYWSSNEKSYDGEPEPTIAYTIYFSSGKLNYDTKSNKQYICPVLAF